MSWLAASLVVLLAVFPFAALAIPASGGHFPSRAPTLTRVIRTAPIKIVGTGARLTAAPFAAKRVTTRPLTIVGTGQPLTPKPFAPRTIRTIPITILGTGSIR